MDAATTILGSILALVGVLASVVVAFLGKRGENAITGYSSLTGDLQEERDRLDRKVTDLERRVGDLERLLVEASAHAAEQSAQRASDLVEITRLRALVISHGGQP